MFVTVIRPAEECELYINVTMIWKIEVKYGVPGSDPKALYYTSLEAGRANPEAIRVYTVYAGGETIRVVGVPGDPIAKVFEDICKNAIKG